MLIPENLLKSIVSGEPNLIPVKHPLIVRNIGDSEHFAIHGVVLLCIIVGL